jgi:hypothetical protein
LFTRLFVPGFFLMTKSLNKMRPCVKVFLDNGVSNGYMKESDDFLMMRHAIITELFTIGIEKNKAEEIMVKWNELCKPPLTGNNLNRKLIAYITWVYSHECRLSCKKLEGYCLSNTLTCSYKNRQLKELTYTVADSSKYLEKKYRAYGRGYIANIVLMALLNSRKEKNSNILFCSMAEIVDRVYINCGHKLEKMQASRSVRVLEEAGFIKINSGSNKLEQRMANEYTFLDWKPTDVDTAQILAQSNAMQISPMGNTSLHNMGNSSDSYMGNSVGSGSL